MNNKELEELQEKVYGISNSMLPLNMFFNDIRDNPNENYDKELAYKDLEIITNHIINIHNKLDKLEKVIEIMRTKDVHINIIYCTENRRTYNSLMDYTEDFLNDDEYELLKEIFAS